MENTAKGKTRKSQLPQMQNIAGERKMKRLNYKKVGDHRDMVSMKCTMCHVTLVDYRKDINKAWKYHLTVCERKK